MKKAYRKLTKDQKERGVIFSSQLEPSDTIHEVFETDADKERKIELLKDDSFFNGSIYTRNVIRQ